MKGTNEAGSIGEAVRRYLAPTPVERMKLAVEEMRAQVARLTGGSR